MYLLGVVVRAECLLQLLAAYLAHQRIERLVDVVTQGRRCLEEGAAKLIGQIFALLGGDASLRFQIHLVGYQHQRYVLRQAYASDQFPVFGCLLKAVTIGHRVAYYETFPAAHILVPHGRKLNLTSSVEYVQQSGLIVNHSLLLVRVLCAQKR